MSKKGAFFLPSIRLKGSMALEGSLVLPIFLFFMMTILLSLEAVRIQSNVQEALHQAGNERAFTQNRTEDQKGLNTDVSERITAYIEKQEFPYLCVAKGKDGIVVSDCSSVTDKGLVRLKASYQLKPFIRWIPVGNLTFEDEYYSHAWVGFLGTEDTGQRTEQDSYVYITKTGTKYHVSCDCTYLRIPVKAVNGGQIHELRNASGGKYYPCERCRPKESGLLFVTEEGSRYHGEADCSSLKRTVFMIPLKEADGYTPCKKCGG
ncbi:MAG: hypothetical protein NC429_12155 [Lachnospiraceae bacterium]|nr:hypothetical protein [Lachnospiraceae bacterium]